MLLFAWSVFIAAWLLLFTFGVSPVSALIHVALAIADGAFGWKAFLPFGTGRSGR